MFIEQNSATAKSAVSEICSGILQDILTISLPQDEGPTKSNLAVDSSIHKECLIKKVVSLCNCTQTGEVKILVKKITDFENEQQKRTKNKNANTILAKIDNIVIKEDEKSEITTNNEMSHVHCQKSNIEYFISENYQNDVCKCQITNDCVEPNLVRREKHVCQKSTHEICKIDSCTGQIRTTADKINEITDKNDEYISNGLDIVDKPVITCQNDKSRGAICKISKNNMEEMSDFLVRACEKRQLRRLSLPEPQIVAEEYQINEMSDPYASILEQGDHIMDTFHNLLTDNGNLTVRISFSYCAKLLAVLLTLNTIFFSKIIIWDSFLQHLF